VREAHVDAGLPLARRQRVGVPLDNERRVVPAVRLAVTDEGTDGRSRDHFTVRSPTFATYRRLPWRLKPLRVSRTDCPSIPPNRRSQALMDF
jgi:hypothetical protein